MTIPRDSIDSLTGLRFIAAFTIALGHYYQSWLEVSGIGMPLFFTLSGFIIHYVYAASFAGDWRPAAREFVVARFSRIYPLYLVLMVYYLVRTDMGSRLLQPSNWETGAAYILGVWTWWPFIVDGHPLLDWHYHVSWSISTELFFYVAYALVLYRVAGIRSFRRCAGLLAGFCALAYLWFYGLFLTRDIWEPVGRAFFWEFAPYPTNFGESFYRWFLYFSPYSRIFEFIGGVLTAQAFVLVRGNLRLRARIPAGILVWLALAVLLSLWALFFYNGMRNPWLTPGNTSWQAFVVNLHMNFLLAPACYVLIFALALGGSLASRALAAAIPRWLGDISYSTYLSHLMAERIVTMLRVDFAATVPHLIAVFVAIYALSWALYRVVEVPAKRFLREWLFAPKPRLRPRPRPAPAAFAELPARTGTDG